MSETPLISVITATFNAEATISRLGESLSEQEYRDFEWIVQDGGSTDDTVARALLHQRARPVVHSAKDRGIYDAFNKAIDSARGQYVLFLGADDRLSDPEALLDASRALAAEQPDILLARVKYADGPEFISRLSATTLVINSVHHQGVFYRRESIGAFRYDLAAPVVADYELNLIAYRMRWRRAALDRVIAVCDDGGVSRTTSERELYRELRRLRRKHVGPLLTWATWLVGMLNVGRRHALRRFGR